MADSNFKSPILQKISIAKPDITTKPITSNNFQQREFKSNLLRKSFGQEPISQPTISTEVPIVEKTSFIPKPVLQAFNSDSPIFKSTLGGIASSLFPNKFGEETDRLRKRFLDSASLGITGEADKALGKDVSYRDGRSFSDDKLGATLDLAATIGGYFVPGLGAAKIAKTVGLGAKQIPKLIQGATTLQKTGRLGKIAVQQAKEGIAVGSAIGTAEVGVREAINPDDYSAKQNIGKITIDTLGGVVLDPLAYAGGKGIGKLYSKVFKNIEKQPEVQQTIQQIDALKNIPEVKTEITDVIEGIKTPLEVVNKIAPGVKLPKIAKKTVGKIEFVSTTGKTYDKKFLDEKAKKIQLQDNPFYELKVSENEFKLIDRNTLKEFSSGTNKKELIANANEKIKLEKELKQGEDEFDKIFLNEKQIKKIKEVKDFYSNITKSQNSLSFLTKQEKGIYKKGAAMNQAADVRNIVQGDYLIPVPKGLTEKELNAKIKSFLAVKPQDKVIVEGKKAIVQTSGFGKTKVKFEDGAEKTYPTKDISKQSELNKIKEKQKNKLNEIKEKQKEVLNIISEKKQSLKKVDRLKRIEKLPKKKFQNILKKGLSKGDFNKIEKKQTVRQQNKDFFQKVDEQSKIRKDAPTAEELANMPINSQVAVAKLGLKDSAQKAAEDFQRDYVDIWNPLKKIDANIHEIKADTVRANNLTNESVYESSQVDLNGNVVGDSLTKIVKSSGNATEFSNYLIYRQAISRGEKGDLVFSKEKTEALGLTPNKMKEIVKELEKKYPSFIKAGKDWNGYWANLRKMQLDEDNWTPEFTAKLESAYPNYAPLFRDLAEKTRVAINKGVKIGGSELEVLDPVISSIELTRLYNNFLLHNRANKELLNRIRENPEVYKELGIEIDKIENLNEKDLSENIVKELSDFENELKMDSLEKNNYITAVEKGKKIRIKIQDPEIYQAFASVPSESQGIVLRSIENLTKLTKQAATGALAPIWTTKGLVMDLSRALLNAENPIMHFGLIFKALASSIARNFDAGKNLRKMADNFFYAGGGFNAAQRVAPEARFKVEEVIGKGGTFARVKRIINPFNAKSFFSQFNDLVENINRIAAYEYKIKKFTGGKRQPTVEEVRKAMKYSREITTDYTIRGKKARELEKYFAYTTSSIAGTTQLLKSIKKNPAKTIAIIGIGTMLPALYEYARFRNDKDYQNLPTRERFRNIIIGKTAEGKFIKIALDPQLSYLKEILNRSFQAYNQYDKDTFEGAMEELLNSYAPPPLQGVLKAFTSGDGIAGGVRGLGMASSLSPFVAVATNKTFTNAPIESLEYQLSPLRPGLRYNETTSNVSKKIGEITNFSPMKIDYLLKNYTGDLGRIVLPLNSDVGSIKTEDVLRNFLTDPQFTNTLAVQFYKGRDKLRSVREEFKELDKELPKWYNERLYQGITSQANNSVSKRLSYLNQLKRTTSLDKTLTVTQRKDKIRNIQKAINEIYLDWNTLMESYGVPLK